MNMCVCECEWERERERESETEKERKYRESNPGHLLGNGHLSRDVQLVAVALGQLAEEWFGLNRIGDDGAPDDAVALVHAGAHVRNDVLVTDVHQRLDIALIKWSLFNFLKAWISEVLQYSKMLNT